MFFSEQKVSGQDLLAFINKGRGESEQVKEENLYIPADYSIVAEYLAKLNGMYIFFEKDPDPDYQGQLFYFFKNKPRQEEKYGFLSANYGSCEMCDELQACSNLKDLVDLTQRYNDSDLKLFKTREEYERWLMGEAEGESGSWWCSQEQTKKMFKEALEALQET